MLTLAQARKHLRIDDDLLDDDSLITSLIAAAYEFAESYTNRVIIEREEVLKLDCFESVVIELPKIPAISITEIAYKDTSDAAQVFADYYLNLRELSATVQPKLGLSWPDTNGDYENISITYQAGYALIPEKINQAVRLIIGSLYEQRENHIVGVSINEIPVSAEYLLNSYRALL